MPAIAGAFQRNASPLPVDLLSRLTAPVAHRGPGGIRYWSDAKAAFAYLAAAGELGQASVQPLHDPASGCSIVFDGRIDDRPRLAAQLGSPVLADADAATLALCAYARWGDGCAHRLLGDFAFAIWDARLRRLLCVRDIMGIRPFFYYSSPDLFLFGSEVRQILGDPRVPVRPNEGMLGEYLACAFVNKEETLFAGIRRLPPAHLMEIYEGRAVLRRYWDIDPGYRVRHRRFDDYVDDFVERFDAAVADRIRGIARPASTLSGGIDSSSVAGMAQRILSRSSPGARLPTYSVTYPGRSCDERRYIEIVAEAQGLKAHYFPWTGGFTGIDWYAQSAQTRDIPEYPVASAARAMRRGAAQDGVQVLLTGEGGDSWMLRRDYPYLDRLRALKLKDLWGEIHYRATRRGWRFVSVRLLRTLTWWLAPPWLRAAAERRHPPYVRTPFIAARFSSQIDLIERLRADAGGARFCDLGLWAIYRFATSGPFMQAYEMLSADEAYYGFEHAHPFHDRRVIELQMAIPDTIRGHRGEDRLLLRQSLRPLLPPAIARRYDAVEFSPVFAQALKEPQVRAVLDSKRTLERPWLDTARFRAAWTAAMQGYERAPGAFGSKLLPIWMVFAIECWYRSQFERCSSTPAPLYLRQDIPSG